jgi:outer membrane protein OmpA-like peptidoglycan-associated protein
MKTKLIGLSLLATIAAVPTAHAQGLGDKIEIGAFGQFTKLDEKIKMDNVAAIGGMFGASVYKWFGVQGDVQLGTTKATRTPFEDITYRPARLLGTVTLPLTSSQKAALVLGAGYVNSIYAGRSTANEYEDGFSALAGIKLCSSGKWGARIDGIMDRNPSPNEQDITGTSSNLGLRAGVTYALRGGCATADKFDWTLKVDPASATVNRGSERQFALSATDAKGKIIQLKNVKDLACSTSDASIATVDNTGKVKAVKYGTATITCTGTQRKLQRSASATVTVPPPSWTLTLTPKSGSTDVSKTLSFTAKAVDADNVDLGAITWSSANASIASIANGTVTCNAGGSTTITAAKTAYGSSKSETASVECIAPKPVSVALDRALFDFDKAVVLKAGNDTLLVIIDAMKRIPTLRVSVEGHTDRYGSEAYNNTLAKKRAETVTKQLLKLAGKDAASLKDRIVTSSFGEQCLVTTAGADETEPPPAKRGRIAKTDRAAQGDNRRVEVWQLLEGKGAPTGCRAGDERNNRLGFKDLK